MKGSPGKLLCSGLGSSGAIFGLGEWEQELDWAMVMCSCGHAGGSVAYLGGGGAFRRQMDIQGHRHSRVLLRVTELKGSGLKTNRTYCDENRPLCSCSSRRATGHLVSYPPFVSPKVS